MAVFTHISVKSTLDISRMVEGDVLMMLLLSKMESKVCVISCVFSQGSL